MRHIPPNMNITLKMKSAIKFLPRKLFQYSKFNLRLGTYINISFKNLNILINLNPFKKSKIIPR